MAEYVEREATCKDCVHYEVCDKYNNVYERELSERYCAECDHFKNKADVVEVRHGHWVWIDDRFRCSVCNSAIPKVKTDKKTFINETYKYCRWCGSKMDGKEGKR